MNATKTPTVYSGMRFVTLPPKIDDQGDRDDGQDDDPVAEREPVAPVREGSRQEAVASEDAGQAREVGKRGVRRQDEQDRGRHLDQVVEGRAGAHERSRSAG